MDITTFFSNYHNHPVLFIGTGLSLRYLNEAYSWDKLLERISLDLWGDAETYLDIKSSCQERGNFQYDKIASILEKRFNDALVADRNGKFKEINDLFYEKMADGINLSRFKIYIQKLLGTVSEKENLKPEISELKKTRKNIGSIVTTNYDEFIEQTFEFNPLVGNDILLSNPYGSVYKIHGCVSDPQKIIITDDDYKIFDDKYELIKAQLLSLFIHNPIIFIRYNIRDNNIKKILKTIFTYVERNTPEAEKIRKNFLLVEYDQGSSNLEITEHDIDMEGFSTIRINKIKTDDFKSIYSALSELNLPVSAMDIRKVQSIVKEIYSGGAIKVRITEDLDSMKNEDRILAIGSTKTIQYQYLSSKEMIKSYFKIIDEANSGVLSLIDQQKIQTNQYFPIYGFSKINNTIAASSNLKQSQETKLLTLISNIKSFEKTEHTTIESILNDTSIAETYKINAIIWGIWKKHLCIESIEMYLRKYSEKESTNYRKLVCVYDYIKYKD